MKKMLNNNHKKNPNLSQRITFTTNKINLTTNKNKNIPKITTRISIPQIQEKTTDHLIQEKTTKTKINTPITNLTKANPFTNKEHNSRKLAGTKQSFKNNNANTHPAITKTIKHRKSRREISNLTSRNRWHILHGRLDNSKSKRFLSSHSKEKK